MNMVVLRSFTSREQHCEKTRLVTVLQCALRLSSKKDLTLIIFLFHL